MFTGNRYNEVQLTTTKGNKRELKKLKLTTIMTRDH